MKVIIAGSRSITDPVQVAQAIKESGFEVTEVVSGTARGVDTLGELWAEAASVPVVRFPADWNQYGRGAGYRRNAQMAEYADALVAVWDGQSRGTNHMIEQMESRRKPVFVATVGGQQ